MKSSNPRGILIEITEACPSSCRHCLLPEWKRKNRKKYISIDVWDKILTCLADNGFLFLTISGGDPLMHPRFFDVVEIARKKHFAITLKTSGLLITKEVAEKIKKITPLNVSLSIYSASTSEHDFITGINGSHERTIRAVSLLVENGIRVTVDSPLLHPMTDIERLYSLVTEYTDQWVPDPIIFPGQDLLQSNQSFQITEEEMKQFLRFMFEKGLYSMEELVDDPPSKGICGFGRHALFLDSDTQWHRCPLDFPVLTEFGKDSFEAVQELSTDLRRKIKQSRECNECELLRFCHPCPALANRENGSFFSCSNSRRKFAEALKDLYYESKSS